MDSIANVFVKGMEQFMACGAANAPTQTESTSTIWRQHSARSGLVESSETFCRQSNQARGQETVTEINRMLQQLDAKPTWLSSLGSMVSMSWMLRP